MIQFKTELPLPEQYYELFNTTGWNEEYRLGQEDLYKTLLKSYHMVSAYDDSRLVGFGRIISDGILHAMIYEMIVIPECQRKGIGQEILKRLIAKCKEDNIRDIQLFCAKGKRAFYEKHGFTARAEDAPGMQYNNI